MNDPAVYMSARRWVTLVLAVTLFSAQTAWAKTQVLTLKWGELAAAVANREATLLLSRSVRVVGTISGVREDTLVMSIRKSSAKSSYSPGEASIPRTEILEIRLKRISGPARLIGAAGAGTAASLGSLGWALSDSRVDVPDSTRAVQWAAISAGATIGGYLAGRAIDTKETIIRIASDR